MARDTVDGMVNRPAAPKPPEPAKNRAEPKGESGMMTFRIDDQLRMRVVKRARQKEMTVSELIRTAVEFYLA